MKKAIVGFSDEYRFLSNFFFPAHVIWEMAVFPTTEHAYQAAKMKSTAHFVLVALQTTPGRAKREGRKHPMRDDWEDVRQNVMKEINEMKFAIPKLREMLLATGDAHLEEGNNWGDQFWGTVDGVGENHLGKILMEIRDEIRRNE